MIELRQLRYLIAAAEAGSFSRAARSINIKQATLSRHVLEIEKRLGPSLDGLRWKSHLELARVPLDDLAAVDNRIQALWITADLVGVILFTWDTGPVQIIHAIKKAREESADPYAFTIKADALIRKELYRKMYMEGDKYCDLPRRLRGC